MAQALREEYATDQQGRGYRVNHAVRVTKAGVQYTFWAMLGYAPHVHIWRRHWLRGGNKSAGIAFN